MAPNSGSLAERAERWRHEIEIRRLAYRDAHLEVEHVGGHRVLVADEAGFECRAAWNILGTRVTIRLDHQRLGRAGREQCRHARLEPREIVGGELEAVAPGKQPDELRAFGGGAGRQQRYLDIDAPGALQVHFNEVGTRGSK